MTNEEVLLEEIHELEETVSTTSKRNHALVSGLYAVLVTLNNIEKANVTQDPVIFNLVKEGRKTARDTLKEAAQ